MAHLTATATVEERAKNSGGISAEPIYRLVARVIAQRHSGGGTLLDVGCGVGNLWPYVQGQFADYWGADVIRHPGLPDDLKFIQVDMDSGRIPLPDAAADVVVGVETIEHLENPRAFFRELKRLTRPGGQVIVTTPNQLSLLSKMTLVVKNQFNAFQAGSYPAHITALLEIDLRRIAAECGLIDSKIHYTDSGRIPFTPRHWPRMLYGRAFSDNLLLAATRMKSVAESGGEGRNERNAAIEG